MSKYQLKLKIPGKGILLTSKLFTMKKILLVLLIAASTAFVSCTKDKDDVLQQANNSTNNSTGNSDIINPFAVRGNWVITDLLIAGVNHGAEFSNTSLVFNPDNSFSVSNDIMAEDGKWLLEKQADNAVYLHLDFTSESINNESWGNIADVWKVKTLELNNLLLESATSDKSMSLQRLSR